MRQKPNMLLISWHRHIQVGGKKIYPSSGWYTRTPTASAARLCSPLQMFKRQHCHNTQKEKKTEKQNVKRRQTSKKPKERHKSIKESGKFFNKNYKTKWRLECIKCILHCHKGVRTTAPTTPTNNRQGEEQWQLRETSKSNRPRHTLCRWKSFRLWRIWKNRIVLNYGTKFSSPRQAKKTKKKPRTTKTFTVSILLKN